jgi:hypothetical protein
MNMLAIRTELIEPRLFGVALLIVWLVVMASLFWVFQFKYTTTWVTFRGSDFQSLAMPPAKLGATVAHYVDSGCPCTRFSKPHIEELEQRWNAVEFKTVTLGGESELNLAFAKFIPASPAVAMWDSEGSLKFFGPYTAGEICGEGDDLLSKALANPGEGQWLNQEAVGCFCPWSAGVET